MGDAAHPMLPYLSQGAAQAIADAAALGIIFSKIKSTKDVPALLQICENIRRPRVELAQSMSLSVRHILHMNDGFQQEARDKQFRLTDQGKATIPDAWLDVEQHKY
ncbi:unnamed protein product, partial [Rotaria sp. Silwood2]